MGGDHGPKTTIAGLAIAQKYHPEIHFLVYGQEKTVVPLLKNHCLVEKNITFIHAADVISANEKPAFVLRRSRNSSMRLAIEAVKEKKAQGVVSAGNTGAYMALSKIILKTIKGIDRPAIMAIMPSCKQDMIVLDVGANVTCLVENLVQFAMMGDAFARFVLKRTNPSVGLLNVGSEDLKGHATVQEAARVLHDISTVQNFYGFIEGNDISAGTTDVIVTDGFTGNIMLKAIEGTAQFISHKFKTSVRSSLWARFGLLFLFKQLKQFSKSMDTRRYNGAIFLGLDGIAVKSHGGTDAVGFSFALKTAVEMITHQVNHHIASGIEELHAISEKDMLCQMKQKV